MSEPAACAMRRNLHQACWSGRTKRQRIAANLQTSRAVVCLLVLPLARRVQCQAATMAAAGASDVQPQSDRFAFPFQYPCQTPRLNVPGSLIPLPPPSHNCSLHVGDLSKTFCRRGAPTWPADTLWCSYPNADNMARHGVTKIKTLRGARKEECHLAMKAFLCTLFNRPCNATGGLIKPVCMYDCLAAYEACGYSKPQRNLQCSEFLKTGWVTYNGDTHYGLNEFDEVMWNTGLPSCEPALLRPGYSVFNVRDRFEPWFPHKSWRYIKEKTFNPDNTTEFSGARKAATRELFWAANFVDDYEECTRAWQNSLA